MKCDICGKPSATIYIDKKYCNMCFSVLNLEEKLNLALADYSFLEKYMDYDIYHHKTNRQDTVILYNGIFCKKSGAALQAKYWIEWKHKNDST